MTSIIKLDHLAKGFGFSLTAGQDERWRVHHIDLGSGDYIYLFTRRLKAHRGQYEFRVGYELSALRQAVLHMFQSSSQLSLHFEVLLSGLHRFCLNHFPLQTREQPYGYLTLADDEQVINEELPRFIRMELERIDTARSANKLLDYFAADDGSHAWGQLFAHSIRLCSIWVLCKAASVPPSRFDFILEKARPYLINDPIYIKLGSRYDECFAGR